MSIDLLTGALGSGKSNWLVSQLIYNKQYAKRAIYHHGIEEFYTGTQIVCRNSVCRTCKKIPMDQKANMRAVEDLTEWQVAGDIIIVDEAQYPYPDRRNGTVPAYIQRLTESRHDGVDLIIVTPNFAFVDVWVRKMVTRTIHFVDGQTGRFKFQHTGCPTSDGQLLHGTREPFKLDESVFGKYKSADYHTNITRGLSRPQKLLRLLLVGLVVSSCVLAYFMTQSRQVMREVAAVDSVPGGSSRQPVASLGAEDYTVVRQIESANALWTDPDLFDTRPAVDNYPESAPAFAAVSSPVVIVPEFVGCVASAVKCQCYDARALKYETSRSYCVAYAENRIARHIAPAGAAQGPALRGPRGGMEP